MQNTQVICESNPFDDIYNEMYQSVHGIPFPASEDNRGFSFDEQDVGKIINGNVVQSRLGQGDNALFVIWFKYST
jgi:hypothetical protein